MADFRFMYNTLFNAATDAQELIRAGQVEKGLELLGRVQRACETRYLREGDDDIDYRTAYAILDEATFWLIVAMDGGDYDGAQKILSRACDRCAEFFTRSARAMGLEIDDGDGTS